MQRLTVNQLLKINIKIYNELMYTTLELLIRIWLKKHISPFIIQFFFDLCPIPNLIAQRTNRAKPSKSDTKTPPGANRQ